MSNVRKKLIEVALPLVAINLASAREKSIRHGHPSTLHLWWARRPLAAARAVIFAQMVDDPSSWPDLFPTENAQAKERQRLFRIIEDFVLWENLGNAKALQSAQEEIWNSWRRTCAENSDSARSEEIFRRDVLPAFHDPFAGGGALPLEAQRLGLVPFASDLNPVAVLINKAMIEIPPKWAGHTPISRMNLFKVHEQQMGARGLAEDVRYYGKWMCSKATTLIGDRYPSVTITKEVAEEREDLRNLVGEELKVIAWIWVRTVKSPNPAFQDVDVPLASSFILSSVSNREAYVDPVVLKESYLFKVRTGKAPDSSYLEGTKMARGANFRCLLSGVPISSEYIKGEGTRGRMGVRLMAIVAEGPKGRVYLSPTVEHETIALSTEPSWFPENPLPADMRSHWTPPYGLKTYGDLFTSRQLLALSTFSDLISDLRSQVQADYEQRLPVASSEAEAAGREYANAIATYLTFAIDKCSDYWSSICTWHSSREIIRNTFGRQAIPMSWDFAETNPFSSSTGNWLAMVEWAARALATVPASIGGTVTQADAMEQGISRDKVVSTDPPYYDNIGYADLSDYFYIWMRRSLQDVYPDLFSTIAVPKDQEIVATPYRHGGKLRAEQFFLQGMSKAMARLAELAHPSFPVTIYYAFKQSETTLGSGEASTGWETFLESVLNAGFSISGTWPIRTELGNRMIGSGTNALASSIVLVCRKRQTSALGATVREFNASLERELASAVTNLQRGNIAPVDLQQAAIGPGMAIFTRYSKVLKADGSALKVKDALSMINKVLGQLLSEQEGDFDSDTQWSFLWFQQFGFSEGDYGFADTLSKAKNIAVEHLVDVGIVLSSRGKVRLLRAEEYDLEWDASKGPQISVWEIVHRISARLANGGEAGGAELITQIGYRAESARELAYKLYSVCNKAKKYQDAQRYNALVQSWPEMLRLSEEAPKKLSASDSLFGGLVNDGHD